VRELLSIAGPACLSAADEHTTSVVDADAVASFPICSGADKSASVDISLRSNGSGSGGEPVGKRNCAGRACAQPSSKRTDETDPQTLETLVVTGKNRTIVFRGGFEVAARLGGAAGIAGLRFITKAKKMGLGSKTKIRKSRE
jgi:hypothetical protein